ncbi:hypothetical protein ASE00_13640 [Sphingomonas sp. Root710]|nr:hypothetical protein ASE00_13640 [Sphingomonas sp. Root710]
MTPNVHFDRGTQGTGVFTIGIRGIKQGSTELTNEQAVATYVDGVYQGTPLGSAVLLGPDLAGIEVLRGPQGTLFGRNTVGGALLINTKQPSSDWEARLMSGVGNYGLFELQGMVNAPLSDDVAVRLNYARSKSDGFAKDITSNTRLGDSDVHFLRGQLKASAGAAEFVLRAHWFRSKSGGNLLQPVYLTPGGLAANVTAGKLGLTPGAPGTATAVTDYFLNCAGGSAAPNIKDKCYDADNPVGSSYKEWATSLTGSLELSDSVQLKSITAFTKYKQAQAQDYDGSRIQLLWNNSAPYGHVLTQELQLNGNLMDHRLEFASGVFYFRHWNNDHAFNEAIGRSRAELISYHTDQSLGVYGQASLKLTDALRGTVGLRYTQEWKRAKTSQFTTVVATGVTSCSLPIATTPGCVARSKIDFNSFDYTFGLDYNVARNTLAYVRVARGFLAGGINQRSTTNVPFVTYKPQVAINYELGLKTKFLDNHARLNLAVFQTDVDNLQKSVPRTFNDINNVPQTVVAQINAAKARIRGVEVELTLAPFENFEIAGNLGYLDQKYKDFRVNGPAGPQTFDLSGTRFLQSPDWMIGVSPRYTIPLSFGKLLVQADYSWQSSADLAPPVTAAGVNLAATAGRSSIQPSYGLLNARLALTIRNNTEIAIWGKNLTDKRYLNSILDLSDSLGFMNGKVGDPRTYGISVTHNF